MTTGPYHTHAAQIFADVVREHGPRCAVRWADGSQTTYEELDAVSNRIARFLVAHGVRKRDLVCICLEKSLGAYGVLLGCLKAGAAYFVLDVENPVARAKAMIARCRPAHAFIDSADRASLFDCLVTLVPGGHAGGRIEAFAASHSGEPFEPPWPISGADPAYVMFTSGSTGVPKGATMSQSNLVNFIRWTQNEFSIHPDDVFTNVNPLFFDNSVFDIYASLFAGASIVPFGREELRRPDVLVRRIAESECTVYFSVPSLLVYLQTLKLIDRDSFPSMQKIIFGGEGYPKPMLRQLYEHLGHRVTLHNVYGPTECTCICSVYRITADDFADTAGYAPLGRLIPNFLYVIVDADGRGTPPGQVGELCLSGPCVGLGYYGSPGETAAAFVQNPAHDRFLERVYRTGDLVRYDAATDKIHFVGRADTQIKRQGYRIELGEIEHALTTLDDVDEAAVVCVGEEAGRQIVAVVASRRPLRAADVKGSLAERLPKYMTPDSVVVTERLPKNANGKIDRRRIAESVARGELA
jgi:D-alanine--poly(phosphoribitol) ligase subunit 1